ncbi:baseplate J/gp47 family protein [Comamonas koreensis]|uniref:Baseplate J/gp47 family protein n=1 Tax=Comamonas koreensis TaxID=160825 RepID=A0AAW4XZ30_9BURK|nr:baseplate J/gp47 family protein [Comamonas koreensis]MCD2166820.1 baseplate J/gp47 family protein [Comamonas koreensis]
MIDLATLPAPDVVEALNYETILATSKTDLANLLRPHLPAVDDVLALESEPLTKLLESFAMREMAYRARVNDAARAHLLAFARGADLDHLAALVGVTRMDGEADTRLRTRVQLRIAALSSQGTREYYEYQAMTASLNVRAAMATSPTAGRVQLMLWCVDQAQATATQQAVDALVNSDGGRMLGVPITVAVAQPMAINITANIYRARTAPANLLQLLNSRLQTAFAGMADLSAAVGRSYITTLLHVEGVARVEYPDSTAPAEVTAIPVGYFPTLGQVLLVDMGVA